MMDHTALVNEARASREKLGYEVFTEDQNFFTAPGEPRRRWRGSPTSSRSRATTVVITDAKTGKPSPHHAVQVLTYMYAVPQGTAEQFRGNGIPGPRHLPRRQRADPSVSGLERKFIDRLGALIRRLADENPARKRTERLRVPVVRHHRRRLPGAGGGERSGRR